MNFRRFETLEQLIAGTADAIVRMVEQGARVIALSGGTTPPPVYQLLGSGSLKEKLSQFDLIWLEGDERFVPADDPQSNAAMIRRTLFAEGISPRHRFLDFRTEQPSPQEAADDFEARWRELDITRVDLNILGVGDDGHTASLFPGTDALAISERIAVANWVPRLAMWRLTLTLPILQRSLHRVILAAGAGKLPIIQRIQGGEELPIVLASRGEGDTWWFVDRAAAPEV